MKQLFDACYHVILLNFKTVHYKIKCVIYFCWCWHQHEVNVMSHVAEILIELVRSVIAQKFR